MGGTVNPDGKTAHNGHPRLRQLAGQPFGENHPHGRGRPGPDHRNGDQIPGLETALDKQRDRRIRNRSQIHRILGIRQAEQADFCCMKLLPFRLGWPEEGFLHERQAALVAQPLHRRQFPGTCPQDRPGRAEVLQEAQQRAISQVGNELQVQPGKPLFIHSLPSILEVSRTRPILPTPAQRHSHML